MGTQFSGQFAAASSQNAVGGDYADFGTAFTAACWFKTAAPADGAQILNKQGTGNDLWEIYINTVSHKVNTYIQDSTGANFRGRLGTTTCDDDTWHHVSVTWDGTTYLMYIDGTSEGTSDTGGTAPNGNNDGSVRLGSNKTPGAFWDGGIDDVRLWTRAITSGEASSLKTTPCTFANGANLEAWWKLDNDFTDSSGNSRTLTTSASAPTFSSSDVPYATCASGSKLMRRMMTGIT